MLRQLDYQDRVLTAIDAYLDVLKVKKACADKVAASDFAKQAWDALNGDGGLPASRAAIPFSPRMDGCSRPVPNAVLKVPTGGGKTWLAVSGISQMMGLYREP